MHSGKKLEMPDIDNDTLLISLQSVFESIKRFEALLDSETPTDPENIEEQLISHDEALRVLKGVYREQLEKGENLPPIESILINERTT
jgi:hypothetical protein